MITIDEISLACECCRNAGKPAPDYRIQQSSAYPVEYTPRSRVTRIDRSGSYSRAVMESNGWNPSKGLASNAAAEAASDAAEALIAEIENKGGHAYAKIMTSSQVSSGFWANAPRGVEKHVTFIEKTPISLKLPQGEVDPVDVMYQRDDGTWNCIWLPRKTGAGFSGGWRGFAIDLELFPGDVCVFEVDETSKPGGRRSADVLIVHILRAFDYDTESVREQRKEQAAAVALQETEEQNEDDDDDDDELEFEKDESSDDEQELGDEEEDDNDDEEKTKMMDKRNDTAIIDFRNGNEGNEEEFFEKMDEDEEGDATEIVRKKAPTSKTTRVQLVKKRKRQIFVRTTAAAIETELENDNNEEEEEAVGKPRAKANRRRQTTRTSTAAAARKKSEKSSSKISSKKQKKNNLAPVPPPVSIFEQEKGTDEDEIPEEEEEEEFFVEKIERVRTESDGTKRYFVKWYGYPRSENTWEPVEMFNAPPERYPRAAGVKL